MSTFIGIVLCIGSACFACYSVIKLVGAIKERKAKKAAKPDADSTDIEKGN